MQEKSFVCVIMLFFAITLPFFTVSVRALEGEVTQHSSSGQALATSINVNYSRVLDHIIRLTDFGSRVTGYQGNRLAAKYIADSFNESGLEVKVHNYGVVVPQGTGATLEVTSPIKRSFEAYSLWPNGIQTSPANNLQGRLVYGSGIKKESFDGIDLHGSIVLMEFNSGDNWLFAADMGASAVIFIEPDDTSRSEALDKMTQAPVNFPRLFVSKSIGNELKNLVLGSTEKVWVTIDSRVSWKEVTAENIIGIVNGKQRNDILVIACHYDTWSIVPDKAYGASDALGIAFLLELARSFQNIDSEKTIWFVALSGHWQALAGGREFVEDHYFSDQVQNGTLRPWMFINLGPFSWDTNEIQLLGISHYSGAGQQLGTLFDRYVWLVKRISDYYLQDQGLTQTIKELTNQPPRNLLNERLSSLMWWGSMQTPYILESEVVLMTGSIGFTILSSPASTYDRLFGIPINDLEYVKDKVDRLKPQFTIISFILGMLASESEWPLKWDNVRPIRAITAGYTWNPSINAGFIKLIGKVTCFDYIKAWYKNIPNAIVVLRSLSNAFPFSRVITMSDENGTFEIHGLAPFTLCYERSGYDLEAWVLNETDGTILYAPDKGIHGAKTFTTMILPLTHPAKSTVVVADLRPITMFSILDPNYIRPLAMLDPRSGLLRTQDLYVSIGGEVKTLDFHLRSELLAYGDFYRPWETIAMSFAPPYSKVAVTITTGTLATRAQWPIFLTNSTETEPEGVGIQISAKPVSIYFTEYQVANDMYLVARNRYDNLRSFNVRSISVEEALINSEHCLKLANTAYTSKNYSRAQSYAMFSYIWANKAYLEIMSLIQDSAAVTIAMFFLIVLTSLIFERLIFSYESGSRRLIATSLINVGLILALSQLHPSFHLMSNSVVGLFGSVLMIMFFLVIGILSLETEKVAKTISERFLGRHALVTDRVGSVFLGFSSSTRFMRKHALRSFLTLLTTFTMVASLISLTSTSSYNQLRSSPVSYQVEDTIYETGVFIERDYGIPPFGLLSPVLPDIIQQFYGDSVTVMPRIVYYPQTVRYWGGTTIELVSQHNFTRINAVIGLSPTESEILVGNVSVLYLRSFTDEDYDVCLLTASQARALNVTIGDAVTFKNSKLKVIGILEEDILNTLRDLNGLSIGAPDPFYVSQFAKDFVYPERVVTVPRLKWSKLLIVPLRFALDLGGHVSSINIIPRDEASIPRIEKLARDLAMNLDLGILLKSGGNIFKFSRVHAYYTLGYEAVMVVVAMGTLNIVLTIFSSVREKIRDINTLAVCGLSPSGSMSMLLVEALIYALIGSILGYFAGYAFNTTMRFSGLLPEYFPFNYSSMAIVYSILTVIAATFIGALIPARMAARTVTPSLRRIWELPTKPRGDAWSIPLPFRASTEEESVATLCFLREYFEKGGHVSRTYMVSKVGTVSYQNKKLELEVKHVPYEMSIISSVTIDTLKMNDVFTFSVDLKRISGPSRMWVSSCRHFIDAVRKQFMLWGTLPGLEHKKYMDAEKRE